MNKTDYDHLREMGFADIQPQMEDAHAVYYDAVAKGVIVEVKIEHEDEDGDRRVSYKELGREDWITCGYIYAEEDEEDEEQ